MKQIIFSAAISLFILANSSLWSVAHADSRPSSKNATSADLTYAVYAGGIHAVNARLTIKSDGKTYNTTLSAGTQGFLKKLANWSGIFASEGRIKNGKPYPLKHQSDSSWKNNVETKKFRYDGAGNVTSYKVSEGGKDITPPAPDTSLQKSVSDNLSATLHLLLQLPKKKTCAGDSVVYDGDRTYRLKFHTTQLETLKKSRYNIYDGASVSCTVEVVPEKGLWRKKPRGWLSIQEQGRQKGELPTIWFGAIEGKPNFYVPVKIRVRTDYGTLFMHLTSVK